MTNAKIHYSNIDDMLRDLNLPLIKHSLFYIARFEDHEFNESYSDTYTHEFFEISFSLGYDAQVSVGHQVSSVLDNSLIFVSPGQVVKWEGNLIAPDKVVGYILLFKPEFLLFAKGVFSFYELFPFLNRNTSSSYQLSEEQKMLIQDLLDTINQEYKRNDVNSIEIIRSFLTILLFKAKRILEFNTTKRLVGTRADEITYQFENAIIQTAHKRQKIQFYARMLNISPIYLSECIKKSTGKTAKQIINEYLILEAKSLLRQSTESVSQIAYNLGFEDDSNFVKYFKKQTGLTPRSFRNEGR